MTETYLSFYLRNNRIHIFVEALRGISSPQFICFMMGNHADSLVLAPYGKKDFHSHRVPQSVYHGKKSLELASIRLCKMLIESLHWDANMSYRVPGTIIEQQNVVIFDLKRAKGFRK